MSNLTPYRTASDQTKAKHWSGPYVDATHDRPDQEISHFVKPIQPPPNSPARSCATAATYNSNDCGDDVIVGKRLVSPNTSPDRGNIRLLAFQDEISMAMKARQDDSVTSAPLMIVPVVLTRRQIENKKLEDNHNNINKKLNARARAARDAAQRTRLLMQHFRLAEKTESTRPKKEDTADNMRYLDTVDGMECKTEIKLELKAKKQAISLLHAASSTSEVPEHRTFV